MLKYLQMSVDLYLRKIDLVYIGADSMMLKWFNKVLNNLWYYSKDDRY